MKCRPVRLLRDKWRIQSSTYIYLFIYVYVTMLFAVSGILRLFLKGENFKLLGGNLHQITNKRPTFNNMI